MPLDEEPLDDEPVALDPEEPPLDALPVVLDPLLPEVDVLPDVELPDPLPEPGLPVLVGLLAQPARRPRATSDTGLTNRENKRAMMTSFKEWLRAPLAIKQPSTRCWRR
jgi:hypothetical protein